MCSIKVRRNNQFLGNLAWYFTQTQVLIFLCLTLVTPGLIIFVLESKALIGLWIDGVNFDPWSSRFWNFDLWSSPLKFWSSHLKFWYLIQDFWNFDTGIPKFWSSHIWNFWYLIYLILKFWSKYWTPPSRALLWQHRNIMPIYMRLSIWGEI